MNCPARARDKSGGKPFSRKGFPPLLVPRFPPANPPAAFSFGERGAKEKAKQKEKRRWGNVPLFEKSGAKTFESGVSRHKVFQNMVGTAFLFCFKSFWEGGVNCPARARDKSGGKPFSRKGFPPLLVPSFPRSPRAITVCRISPPPGAGSVPGKRRQNILQYQTAETAKRKSEARQARPFP